MKFIACGDLHVTGQTPIARIDNYIDTVFKKLRFMIEYANKNKLCIYNAGDTTDRPRPPLFLVYRLLYEVKQLTNKMTMIPGNHDLPGHVNDNLHLSAVGILDHADNVQIINTPLEQYAEIEVERDTKIALVHKLILEPGYKEEPKFVYSSVKKEFEYMKKNNIRVLVSSDNHTPFFCKDGKHLLVNPGSMMRKTIKQIEHTPRFYVVDTQELTAEPVYYPIKQGVFNPEHIAGKNNNADLFESFIDTLNSTEEFDLSFEDNLFSVIKQKKIRKGVKNIIQEIQEVIT